MTDKEDKNSNLAGWAALVTAIAALITAIGFPSFFPDLVKQFLLQPSSQSSPSAMPQVASSASGGQASSSSSVSSQSANRTPPVEAVLNLRQGMNYLEARRILFAAGWKPATINASNSEDAGSIGTDPSERLGQNLPELRSCQPTGLGLCVGKLELEDGRSLTVTVTGMNPPNLLSWDSSFYIEPSKMKLDVIKQLRAGLPYRKIEQFLVAEGWQSPVVNPMYRANELPSSALNFLKEFANFKDCQVDGEEIKRCRFTFSIEGEKNLTITTDVNRVGSQYEPIIRSWSLE